MTERGRLDLEGVLLGPGETWEALRAQCDRSAVRVEALCGIVSLGGSEVGLEALGQLTGRSVEELRPVLARLVQDGLAACFGVPDQECWQVTAAGFQEVELLRTSTNGDYHASDPR